MADDTKPIVPYYQGVPLEFMGNLFDASPRFYFVPTKERRPVFVTATEVAAMYRDGVVVVPDA